MRSLKTTVSGTEIVYEIRNPDCYQFNLTEDQLDGMGGKVTTNFTTTCRDGKLEPPVIPGM